MVGFEEFMGYVGKGQLTLVVGMPGVGKSLVGLELARMAAWWRKPEGAGGVQDGGGTGTVWVPSEGRDGDNMGAGEGAVGDGVGTGEGAGRERGVSIVVSAEETEEEMTRRLRGIGAWLMRGEVDRQPGEVVVLSAATTLVPEEQPTKWKDHYDPPLIRWLRKNAAIRGRLRLVVLDPLPWFLGEFDGKGVQGMRKVLGPLMEMAERWGFGVVGVMHLNKSGRGPMLYRTMGSMAYTALARTVLLVKEDGEERWDGERVVASGRRLVVALKCNGREDGKGRGFRVESGERGPRVVWEEGEVVCRGEEVEAGGLGRVEEAVAYLRAVLGEGAVESRRVTKEAGRVGISARTLERARRVLGVRCEREGEGWVMRLGS